MINNWIFGPLAPTEAIGQTRLRPPYDGVGGGGEHKLFSIWILIEKGTDIRFGHPHKFFSIWILIEKGTDIRFGNPHKLFSIWILIVKGTDIRFGHLHKLFI